MDRMLMFFHALAFAMGMLTGFDGGWSHVSGGAIVSPGDSGGSMPGDSGGSMPAYGGQSSEY